MIKKKTSCRICDGKLVVMFDMGNIYPSDFPLSGNELVKLPLTLTACNKCGLIQLNHTVDSDRMYRQYYYQSRLNSSMVEALKDIRCSVAKKVNLDRGDVVVDIGANDGTLLSMFHDMYTIGFDPALNLRKLGESLCDVYINDYFSADLYPCDKKAKIITSIAMFYDLDDPHSFVRDVTRILDKDGTWVIQMTDLVSMMKANAFDNICFEHLEYYSLSILQGLLEQYNLQVFDVEYNNVNGGSIRVYVCFCGTTLVKNAVSDALIKEREYLGADSLAMFRGRVERAKEILMSFIRTEYEKGKRLCVLGASTKGNTLLQYYGLDNSIIEHAAEINPEKFGRRTVGTNIPIIPEEQVIESQPDYFIVLPWHFISSFLKTKKKYLLRGGRLIVPLPVPMCYELNEHGDFTKWTLEEKLQPNL